MTKNLPLNKKPLENEVFLKEFVGSSFNGRKYMIETGYNNQVIQIGHQSSFVSFKDLLKVF